MSNHSFCHKAFLRGLKDFYFGSTPKISYTRDDREALQKDWQKTGDYIRKAMKEYERTTTKQ